MENYFTSQRDNIFKNVEVLIYVFDVESCEMERDVHYYQSCLEAILQNSPEAKVFCLIHKMDLVQEDQRHQAERDKKINIIYYYMFCRFILKGSKSFRICLFLCNVSALVHQSGMRPYIRQVL